MEERQRNRSGNSSRSSSRNSSRESYRDSERSSSRSRSQSNRSRRQEDSSILEWISDHFQYIILAVIAIAVILAIIFGVRAYANKKANQDKSAVHPITEEEKAAAAAEAEAGSVTITPSEKLNKADDGVQELVSSYLIAMAAGDVAKVEAVSESVSDETKAYIKNGHSAMGYTDIHVYQYPGTKEGEYVAIATFNYTERKSGNVMPGISAFYILTAEDGTNKIASGTTMERNRSIINEVLGIPEVEQLVIDTNNAIEAAQKAAQTQTTGAPDKEAGAA